MYHMRPVASHLRIGKQKIFWTEWSAKPNIRLNELICDSDTLSARAWHIGPAVYRTVICGGKVGWTPAGFPLHWISSLSGSDLSSCLNIWLTTDKSNEGVGKKGKLWFFVATLVFFSFAPIMCLFLVVRCCWSASFFFDDYEKLGSNRALWASLSFQTVCQRKFFWWSSSSCARNILRTDSHALPGFNSFSHIFFFPCCFGGDNVTFCFFDSEWNYTQHSYSKYSPKSVGKVKLADIHRS